MLPASERDRLFGFAFALAENEGGARLLATPIERLIPVARAASWTLGADLLRFGWAATTSRGVRQPATLFDAVLFALVESSGYDMPTTLGAIGEALARAVEPGAPLPRAPFVGKGPVDLRGFVDALVAASPEHVRRLLLDDVDGTEQYVPHVVRGLGGHSRPSSALTLESVFSGKFKPPLRFGPTVPAAAHQRLAALFALTALGARLGPHTFAPSASSATPKRLLVVEKEETAPALARFTASLRDLIAESTPDARMEIPFDEALLAHQVRATLQKDGVVRFAAGSRPAFLAITPDEDGVQVERLHVTHPAPDVVEREILPACLALVLVLFEDPHAPLRRTLVERFATTDGEKLLIALEKARASTTAHQKPKARATRKRGAPSEELRAGLVMADDVLPLGDDYEQDFRVLPFTRKRAGDAFVQASASRLLHKSTFDDDEREFLTLLATAEDTFGHTEPRLLDAVFARLNTRGDRRFVVEVIGGAPEEVTLRFSRPTLSFVEKAGRSSLVVQVGERTLAPDALRGATKFLLVKDVIDGAPVLHVVTGTVALDELARAIGGFGALRLTPAEREQAIALVTEIAHESIDVADDASSPRAARPPPVTVSVQLSRRVSGGVRVRLGHRALLSARVDGPDDGPDVVIGNDGRERVQVVRDRAAERARLSRVVAALELDDADRDAPFDYVIEGLDRALPVLDRMRALLSEFDLEGRPLLELAWDETSARLDVSGAIEAHALRLSVGAAGEWLSLEGAAHVDESKVELHALVLAARAGKRFVALDDGRFARITDALREELLTLSVGARVRGSVVQVGALAAQSAVALVDAARDVTGRAALDALAARARAADAVVVDAPTALRATLRPYQLEGFRWLARLSTFAGGGVLADDMGLGKTVQTIALLLARADQGPALVVAPTSVIGNWARELARFAPSLRVVSYAESDRERAVGALVSGDVLLVSYALLTRDDVIGTARYATAVFDEAQALKNRDTARARRAVAIDRGFTVALTGTPLENRVAELWSIFHLVVPSLLGSFDSFARDVVAPIEVEGSVAVKRALARVIRPFMLRRRKREVALELPPKTEVTIEVVPSDDERALYEAARRAAIEELARPREGDRNNDQRFRVLALITRLRLLACHPRLFDPDSLVPSAKLTRVLDVLDTLLAEERRALVFSQFTRHLDLVEAELRARRVAFLRLDGSTPADVRTERVRAFQEGRAPIFLISLKAGGTGLNLTAADDVLHLDPWWNPAVEDQATDRAHRIGQDKPVTVTRFVTHGTIEEKIVRLHATKRALVDDILSETDGGARLSVDELVALLKDADDPARATAARAGRKSGLTSTP